jgi:YHS domain-containing protein
VIRIILIGLVILLLARAFWMLMDGVIDAMGGTSEKRRKGGVISNAKFVRDPVCGTYVLTDRSPAVVEEGVTRYFCSEACRDAYQKRA